MYFALVATFVLACCAACGGAYERAEDAWCADVKRDVVRLQPGRMQEAAMAAELVCDTEEAFEGRDGGK